MISLFCFSFWGTSSQMPPIRGLCPWIQLVDFRHPDLLARTLLKDSRPSPVNPFHCKILGMSMGNRISLSKLFTHTHTHTHTHTLASTAHFFALVGRQYVWPAHFWVLNQTLKIPILCSGGRDFSDYHNLSQWLAISAH